MRCDMEGLWKEPSGSVKMCLPPWPKTMEFKLNNEFGKNVGVENK